ncbi:pyridoxamine 5'-phosphate oxidase [archaeon]|nr:MAG: pyridoxamine 5'-phosphate oxidase [archaeon]
MSTKCSLALLRHISILGQRRKLVSADLGTLAKPSTTASAERPLADLRKEYSSRGLVEENVVISNGPFELFEAWLNDAVAARVIEPNAMCLSTCVDNKPSARFVLLKGFDERGFVWYTNYESRKGQELVDNPHAALTFWWGELERSVRIEGKVERVSSAESDEYFNSRPRGSQIGAWTSNQSRAIENRAILEEQERIVAERFGKEGPVPRPPHWGGFRLIPHRIEFWKGRASRLHDRLVFERSCLSSAWALERLQP